MPFEMPFMEEDSTDSGSSTPNSCLSPQSTTTEATSISTNHGANGYSKRKRKTVDLLPLKRSRMKPCDDGPSSLMVSEGKATTVMTNRPFPEAKVDLDKANVLPKECGGLPLSIWESIFLHLPPRSLGSLLSVNHVFHRFLTGASTKPGGPGARVLFHKDSERIWTMARRRHNPHLPRPLHGYKELDMWKLIGGSQCQLCVPSPEPSPLSYHCHIESNLTCQDLDRVDIYWPLAVRSCRKCLKKQFATESELLSSNLSFLLPCMNFAVIKGPSSQPADSASEPDSKIYLRSHVEWLQDKTLKVSQENDSAAAEVWLSRYEVNARKRQSDAARWERWEATGGRAKLFPKAVGATFRRHRDITLNLPTQCQPTSPPATMSGASSPSRKPNKQRPAPSEPTATFEPPTPELSDAVTDMGRKKKSKPAPPKTVEPQPPEPFPHTAVEPIDEDDGSEHAFYRKQRNLFSDQLAACARKTYSINHVAASVRIFVALFHAISAFRAKFQREPPMSLVADALTNAATLRSVRNSDVLVCRICKVDGGTPSNLAATFSLPLLLLHVETHHSERVDLMATLAKNCTLEWFQSVISLPARGNVGPLLTQESVKERDTLAIFRTAISYIPAEETVTIRSNPLLSSRHVPITLPIEEESRQPTTVTDSEPTAIREELNVKIEPDGCTNPLEILGRRQVATATRDFCVPPRHPELECRPRVVTLHDHEQRPCAPSRSRSPPLDRQRPISAYRERNFPAINPPRAREPRPYAYAHSLPSVLYDEFGNQYVRAAPNPYVLYSEPPPRRI